MVDDPFMEQIQPRDPECDSLAAALGNDRARLERRACQYAAWIAKRDGMMRLAVEEYNARFDGDSTVTFACYVSSRAHEFAVTIPEYILRFDPMAPALMIEGPREPEPAPRCDHTIGMDFSQAAKPTRATIALVATSRREAALKAWQTIRANRRAILAEREIAR
jgi:hypothetical protein